MLAKGSVHFHEHNRCDNSEDTNAQVQSGMIILRIAAAALEVYLLLIQYEIAVFNCMIVLAEGLGAVWISRSRAFQPRDPRTYGRKLLHFLHVGVIVLMCQKVQRTVLH